MLHMFSLLFFNYTATTENFTYCHQLSLRDALPIWSGSRHHDATAPPGGFHRCGGIVDPLDCIERSARETLYSSGIVNARSAATKQSSGNARSNCVLDCLVGPSASWQ